jgi:hypothetical protein
MSVRAHLGLEIVGFDHADLLADQIDFDATVDLGFELAVVGQVIAR